MPARLAGEAESKGKADKRRNPNPRLAKEEIEEI